MAKKNNTPSDPHEMMNGKSKPSSEFKKLVEKIANYRVDDEISVEWTTGGIGGGSCWDTGEEEWDPHYAIDGDPEPEFKLFDDVLKEVCPNVTFLQYKELFNKLVKEEHWTEPEYYGNEYRKAKKFVNLADLEHALFEMLLWGQQSQ